MRRSSLMPPTLVDVRLHDVEGALLQPRGEGLPAGQDLAAGDGYRGGVAQQHVIVQVVGMERLLEPVDIVCGEHVRGARRPLVVLRPEGVARAGVHHQERVRPDGLARRAHDGFVHRGSCRARMVPSRS